VRLLLWLVLSLALPAAAAVPCRATSGTGTAVLVELYTSEGCDSCPPADAWLRSLRATALPVVPLAFHVDYWDHLGWRDRFAHPAYAGRQRERAAAAGARFVYTPQVLLAGRDYRGWADAMRFAGDVRNFAAQPARATVDIAVDAHRLAVRASVPAPADRADAVLYIAAFDHDASSRVTAGENRGRTLAHDYVVREWLGPYALDGDGRVAIERAAPQARGGIAAFMQRRANGEVLQALACTAPG
jgi:hypothetical protein